MAARKLVTCPLSTPAGSFFLRRPQKSPAVNPNPKPNRTNPHSTKTRPFSTKSESDRRAHWSTEYRRRLGINDGDLVLMQHPLAIWHPPRDGEIKINFCGRLAGDHNGREEKKHDDETGAITAIARNSSGEVLGVTAGLKKAKKASTIEMQLYALKASANLADELRSTGTHGGPVVYESSSQALVTCIRVDWVGEPEEVIRENMPRDEDLEEVGRSCPIYCGSEDELKEMLPNDLGKLFVLVERDKALAGLT